MFLSAHCIVQLTLWIYFCLLPLQLNATLISLQASLFVINADSMYVRHILKRLELQQFILLPIYKKKKFELLDQGLSTCCSSVLYSDIMLCFNHANVVTLKILWIKAIVTFWKANKFK